MFHRFFDAIWGMVSSNGFETYYMGLQCSGLPGVPTADEARKEYQAYQQAYVWSVGRVGAF